MSCDYLHDSVECAYCMARPVFASATALVPDDVALQQEIRSLTNDDSLSGGGEDYDWQAYTIAAEEPDPTFFLLPCDMICCKRFKHQKSRGSLAKDPP